MKHERPPEYDAVWKRFDAAVAECRRLEFVHGLPTWGEYMEGRVVKTLPNLPSAYVAAVAEWNAARIARNRLYELERQVVSPHQTA